MTFVFAYIGSLNKLPGWPIQLMYLTEAAFVAVAIMCVLIAVILRGKGTQLRRGAVAVAGGVSASFGLIMPFELAPFFFGARGEWMFATILLNLVYPVAAILLIWWFSKFMNVNRTQ